MLIDPEMQKRLRLFSFQLLLLLVLLAVVEIALRLVGYAPGDLRPNWMNFHPVESLEVINNFYVAHEGILIADSNFWKDGQININEEGFRSPSFTSLDTSKKKILFIGDSFTWGLSAQPVANHCFVDLLRNESNYEVINLGIPATDPPQYAALARKYVPRFKPDMTFVVFYMGNDLLTEDRQLRPDEPFYYYTNAGAIFADIDGIHFNTAQEAYHYAMFEKYFLNHPKNSFERLISKSALLSRLYALRFRYEEKMKNEGVIKDSHLTKNYLKQIEQVARQNEVPVRFVLVPEIKDADKNLEAYRTRFADILNDKELKNDWIMLPNAKANFNDYPDGHLNNKGHRYYADFIEGYLKDYFGDKNAK